MTHGQEPIVKTLKEVDMILLSFINPSDIETSLGKEKSKPIVDAFNTIAQNLEKNQNVLDNQQKQIETHQESFDKQQRILADQEVVIHEIKENFEEYKKGDLDRKTEIKKDLLIELATKADIEILNGKIDSLEQKMNGKIDSLDLSTKVELEKMNGKIDSLEQKMNGEFKSIKLWMKMLLALALLIIASYSPTAQVLIKMLKF
jgi:outer membrane murein-binding lipoprotein Lpp